MRSITLSITTTTTQISSYFYFINAVDYSDLSLILTLASVKGSYWNLINWRWSTGGNFRNIRPFSAS